MKDPTREQVLQFYFREARLLDNRRFLAWLELLSPEIEYRMPVRHNYLGAREARNTDNYYAVSRELSPVEEAPFRRDSLQSLDLRARRELSPLTCASNPPARTRRFISNVDIDDAPEGYKLRDGDIFVYSNFMLSYSRHGADNYMYTGERRDVLRPQPEGLRIVERLVVLDWNVVVVPTLGLFF